MKTKNSEERKMIYVDTMTKYSNEHEIKQLSNDVKVCLYLMNVMTADPCGPNFCVGSRVTPGKVYE